MVVMGRNYLLLFAGREARSKHVDAQRGRTYRFESGRWNMEEVWAGDCFSCVSEWWNGMMGMEVYKVRWPEMCREYGGPRDAASVRRSSSSAHSMVNVISCRVSRGLSNTGEVQYRHRGFRPRGNLSRDALSPCAAYRIPNYLYRVLRAG